jgi:hypothetical protein
MYSVKYSYEWRYVLYYHELANCNSEYVVLYIQSFELDQGNMPLEPDPHAHQYPIPPLQVVSHCQWVVVHLQVALSSSAEDT